MDNLAVGIEGNILTDNELWYPKVLQALPAAIYSCNAQGYITQYNQAAEELWGRAPEIGTELWCGAWKLFTSEGSALPLDECPMALAIRNNFAATATEIIIQRPDGSFRNVVSHPQPIFDKSAELIGALNMLVDITEQKVNEKKGARLAAIVQSSDDAIISKDLDGIITSWNNSAERIFGYEEAEVIGKHISILIPFDRLDEEPVIISRLRRGERVDHFETKRVTKSGRLIDISLTISPVRDSTGKIIGASKIARDITQQKELQRSTKESEERFRMAVAATRLGTWEYAPLTNELNWSDECRKVYDLPEDVPVNFDLFSSLIYPDDAEMVREAVNKALDPNDSGDYDIQFRILRYTDHAPRWIRSQGKVFFTANGQPEKFIGTVLDITDEREAKAALERKVQERTEALRRSNQNLLRSNGELEQFAYVASHDLQEPLRKIQTFAERLESKGKTMLNDELMVYIEKIAHSSKKMSVLIKNLLDYARTERREDQFRLLDLNEVVESVEDDLDLVIANTGAQISSDRLPRIEALPPQMRQLFYNLINNSLKFAAEDRPLRLHIGASELTKAEKMAAGLHVPMQFFRLEFRDNGIGFNNEYASRIFTIFQRLNTVHDYPGTGIGLALCKKVVSNHGGVIFASGQENEGAVFTVILPASQQYDEKK